MAKGNYVGLSLLLLLCIPLFVFSADRVVVCEMIGDEE
jgi:hypothetical protein